MSGYYDVKNLNTFRVSDPFATLVQKVEELELKTATGPAGPLDYNLNGFLNNFATNVVGNNKFTLQVDTYGNLKIVPVPLSNQYVGTVEISSRGQFTVKGDDIQSCFFLWYLIKLLLNPIDSGYLIKILTGQTPDIASNFPALYTKFKLRELEIQGKLPPVLTSISIAAREAINQGKELLIPDLQQYVPTVTANDMMCVLIYFSNPLMSDPLFASNNAVYSDDWIRYVLYTNNLAPQPLSNNQYLGVAPGDQQISMSSYMAIGKGLISDGNGISIGSSHWPNLGVQDVAYCNFVIEKENIEFRLFFGKLTPFFKPGQNANEFINGLSGTLAKSNMQYLPNVVLGDLDATTYYIGNQLFPFSFDGPVRMDLLNTDYYDNYVAGQQDLLIPTTVYGPVYKVDSDAGLAYCINNYVTPTLVSNIEHFLKEFIFLSTANQVYDYINKYGVFDFVSVDRSMVDSTGHAISFNNTNNNILNLPTRQRIQATMYVPDTVGAVNFYNFATNGGSTWANMYLDGSDPNVFATVKVGTNQYGISELGSNNTGAVISSGVTSGMVQHSNTQVTDLAPVFDYDLSRAAYDIRPNTNLVLDLSGFYISTGSTGPLNPLELTRQESPADYYEAMSQISAYRPFFEKARWNYYQVYERLGLIEYTSSGAAVADPDWENWATPPFKLTTSEVLGIDQDNRAINLLTIIPGMVDYLSSYYAATGPDYSKPYLQQFSSASGVVTQAALQDAVTVLANWDKTFDIDSVGAALANQLFSGIIERYTLLDYYQIFRKQSINGLYEPAYTAGALLEMNFSYGQQYDDFPQSVAPLGGKWSFDMLLPNFAFTGGIYVKTRELTEADRWDIFRTRLKYPFGFDGDQALDVAEGLVTVPLLGLYPCATVGELFADGLVAALVDLAQTRDEIYLTYCTREGGIESQVDTAVSLGDKIRRKWGALHTVVYPYDFNLDDPEFGLRQYPMPYGTDDYISGSINVIRYFGNWSVVAGYYNGLGFGDIPGFDELADYENPLFYNNTSGDNLISGGLFVDGNICLLGGSAVMKHDSISPDGKITYRGRTFVGADALTSASYRKSLWYFQNNRIPPASDSVAYVFNYQQYAANPTTGRNNLGAAVQVKDYAYGNAF